MDSQFSLGSADNKGILSLLSAIEQTGDQFDTDPDSPKEVTSAFPLEGLELGLALQKAGAAYQCLICSRAALTEPSQAAAMVDIFVELAGVRLSQRIEEIVSRKILPEKHSSQICTECYGVLQQIELLETELQQYKRTITSKFAVSNPVKPKKASPRKTNFAAISAMPSVCEPLEYSEPLIDSKMPLQFLANEKEIEKDLEQMQGKSNSRKSKLDILAETMEEFEVGFGSESDEESSLGMGVLSKKGVYIQECEVCNRKFKNPTMYQRHAKTHIKNKTHKCEECGKIFSTKSNLVTHQKLHFENKTYNCPHCSREFKGKKSLLEHVSSKHNNEKKFACSQCSETFISRHLKNVHERTHTNEKGFICDQCGENFATSQGLSHHKSRHTGDYQYRCKACDKGFNNYKLLEEHYHIHTGSKPYQCSKCDKGFANRGSLWIHMKQHTNTKPYACTECSKAFTHSSHLAVHKRIHSGEKPYKCRICADGFISSNHLKRHMKSHANQLPFACGTCKQTFSQRRQLVSHSNRVHGGNVIEDGLPSVASERREENDLHQTESAFLLNKVGSGSGVEVEEESAGYSLMPVSIVEDGEMGGIIGDSQIEIEGGIELLGQDGLGQTIVLIQVPGQDHQPAQVKIVEHSQ